jgi:hypothetical protein
MDKPVLFLDFDDVMATSRQYYAKKRHPIFNNVYPFDPKCVKVLNSIIETINPVIICSSDWKLHFNLEQLNQIFGWNLINDVITDVTPSLWGVQFEKLKDLEECRAAEIKLFADNNNITNFVAVDDLNLHKWLPNNFVWCSHSTEGIKQSGVKDKIIKILSK